MFWTIRDNRYNQDLGEEFSFSNTDTFKQCQSKHIYNEYLTLTATLLPDEINSSIKTMHEDADSVLAESPSYFYYLKENIKLTGRPVPGSRHLAPGENI